jgi:hypothetical protein
VRNQLISLLTCLRCEGRITRGTPTDDQAAVKELAVNIAKIIAPVLAQDKPPKETGDQPEGMYSSSWYAHNTELTHPLQPLTRTPYSGTAKHSVIAARPTQPSASPLSRRS